VRGIVVCVYVFGNSFFATFKAAEMPAIDYECEIRNFIWFCGNTALPKCISSLVFRNVSEFLPD